MRKIFPLACRAVVAAVGFIATPHVAPAATDTVVVAVPPPSILYGRLFRDVQLAQVFPDQKTFCDLVPNGPPAAIVATYLAERGRPGFSLAAFVAAHFHAPTVGPVVEPAPAGETALAYIATLWNVLQTQTGDVNVTAPFSSLLSLPKPYVVPGGRFSEMYYWDSYFTMLGLEADGRHDVVENVIADFASEIDRYGHVPNGNRTYYLSRSQPPFFSEMIDLLARRDGPSAYVRYLPELRREYEYWMTGAAALRPGFAFRNSVRLADGVVLNRYWDERDEPRDESYREDVQTVALARRPAGDVYRDLRAAAESGWDFSSRWLADGTTLASIQTTSIVPVDLNSLLEHLEATLAHAYALQDDRPAAADFARRAAVRTAEIRSTLWDPQAGLFGDYLWREGRFTHRASAATMYPLFLDIATKQQAATVARNAAAFVQPNGFATTLVTSGQQWDEPNGWAPLQYIAVAGLRQYHDDALAATIAQRWVNVNLTVFASSRKFVEKYDLLTPTGGSGGEYTTQIGFGWTNGVLRELMSLYP